MEYITKINQAKLEESYASYSKYYDKSLEKAGKFGGQMRMPKLTKKQYADAYIATYNDRVSLIEKGQSRTIGNIPQQVATRQTMWMSDKQAKAVQEYIATASGEYVGIERLRRGFGGTEETAQGDVVSAYLADLRNASRDLNNELKEQGILNSHDRALIIGQEIWGSK